MRKRITMTEERTPTQRGDVVPVFTHSKTRFTKKPDGKARLLRQHFVASDNWEFWEVERIKTSGKSGEWVDRWVSPQ